MQYRARPTSLRKIRLERWIASSDRRSRQKSASWRSFLGSAKISQKKGSQKETISLPVYHTLITWEIMLISPYDFSRNKWTWETRCLSIQTNPSRSFRGGTELEMPFPLLIKHLGPEEWSPVRPIQYQFTSSRAGSVLHKNWESRFCLIFFQKIFFGHYWYCLKIITLSRA